MEMGRSAAPSGMQAMMGTPVMISHMRLLSSCKRFPDWKRFRMMPCKGIFWLFRYAAVKPTWFSVPSPASATKRQERCWDITKSAREKAAVSSWRRGQRMPPEPSTVTKSYFPQRISYVSCIFSHSTGFPSICAAKWGETAVSYT